MKKTQKRLKSKLRKGDLVLVIAGDSKNQQGKIIEMDIAASRAIVEGVNLVSKHLKPSTKSPNGGIIKKEAAIHLSNLQFIDVKSGKPSRIGRKLVENGQVVDRPKLGRYLKTSGELIK